MYILTKLHPGQEMPGCTAAIAVSAVTDVHNSPVKCGETRR